LICCYERSPHAWKKTASFTIYGAGHILDCIVRHCRFFDSSRTSRSLSLPVHIHILDLTPAQIRHNEVSCVVDVLAPWAHALLLKAASLGCPEGFTSTHCSAAVAEDGCCSSPTVYTLPYPAPSPLLTRSIPFPFAFSHPESSHAAFAQARATRARA